MHALHPNLGSFARNLRRPACSSHRRVAVSEATTSTLSPTSTSVPVASTSTSKAEEIYIGFEKGDYDRSGGRKGRFIRDDPSKYPSKESFGFLANAAGGWAGGEVALKTKFIKDVPKKDEAQEASKKPEAKPSVSLTKPPAPGREVVYLGYGKEPEDFARRNAGVPGKVVVLSKDEARVYPGKEDVGLMINATGGFAGGEAGLQTYLQTGEVRLRDPRMPARKQFSILAFVGSIALAGVGGSILLTDAFDVGEGLVESEVKAVSSFAIDDTTRTLLLVALGLLGTAGTIGLLRATAEWVQEGLQEARGGVVRAGITVVFGIVVFLAARAIILEP